MKLKLSRKSLDKIYACKEGQKALFKNRTWFQNLFDIGMEVESHHLADIETEDIKWFMGRFILQSHQSDFVKVVKAFHEYSEIGLYSLYEPGIEAAILKGIDKAKRTKDRWSLASAVALMETMDICTIAVALIDIDYSYDYSDENNLYYRCNPLCKYNPMTELAYGKITL